jgi:hypothetical protein
MRRQALALAALLLALPLADCANLAQIAPQTTADAEKALALAHLAYDGAGTALLNAADSGALRGADAAKARALYDQAGAALDAADSADAVANAPGILAALADADTLLAQLRALTAH